MSCSFSQPVELRVAELISGVRSDVALKLFGEDLETLEQVARRAAARLRTLQGARDVRVEQVGGLPYLDVRFDREALARHGLSVDEAQELLEVVLGQRPAGMVQQGERRFPLVVGIQAGGRRPEDVAGLPVILPGGQTVPLGRLARISTHPGLAQVTRENGQRRVVVEANVRGRDLVGFVTEARRAVADLVPPGVFVTWGGQFENYARARNRLAVVVPLSLGLIFFMLYLSLGSGWQAALIFCNVPLAITGGVAALLVRGLPFSISAGVGLRDVAKVLDKRALKVTRRKGDAKSEWASKLGLNESQAKGVAGGVETPKANGTAPAPKVNGAAAAALVADSMASDPQDELRCQTFDLATVSASQRAALLKRPLMSSSDMISRVTPIIDTVRNGGDAGLRSLVVKFDRCSPAENTSFPIVLSAPFPPESLKLDPKVKAAIDQAYHNIRVFHQAQMDKERATLEVETMPGVICSRFARPIEKVGIYVPGGTAILPSTALMLAVPAQVAGCSVVTLATPPRPDGSVSPEIVYIASITGVQSIVRAGGAQAVAALAYGTETVPKVDKIFGPGNQFVTAAKMAVSMDSGSATAIDMPAGPSEVLVRFPCLRTRASPPANRPAKGHCGSHLRTSFRRLRSASAS
jgi:hypothetical protein